MVDLSSCKLAVSHNPMVFGHQKNPNGHLSMGIHGNLNAYSMTDPCMVYPFIPSGKLTSLWNNFIFNWKIHYKRPFSKATLNYQRVYANIGGILMVNVTIYSIHGSYGYILMVTNRKYHPQMAVAFR